MLFLCQNWLGENPTDPRCSGGPVWCEGEIHPTLMGNKKENRSRRRKDSIPDEYIGKKATIIGMPEESERKFILLWSFLFYILKLKFFLEIMQMNLTEQSYYLFQSTYLLKTFELFQKFFWFHSSFLNKAIILRDITSVSLNFVVNTIVIQYCLYYQI